MSAVLLVVNAGSSSLKFAVFEADARLSRLGSGQVERIGRGPRLRAVRPGETTRLLPLPPDAGQAEALDAMLRWFDAEFGERALAIVGHRVVHGGMAYTAPAPVDDEVLARLETLDPIVPLHQPYNLAAIRRLRERAPRVPQLACFDTAFHARWPDVARRFALPRALHDAGVRRYGFHGLSYEYLAGETRRLEPDARRVVIAHLGSGASVCAVDDGRSIDCSLGFTALDGLPMGTRCGPLDPGVAFHLLRGDGATPAAVERMLYQDSGLLGVSGISADMRELLASEAVQAREAVDLFAYHCTRQIAAMAAALGGIDALVFSGGIGENAAPVRERICAPLGFLGIALDAAANARNGERIGGGRVPVRVVPTDEEIVIARACRDALADG
ncbi:MAG TPA: acetate/propionate family kinase [Dokdonella sp.]|nr:acetate/propionate family kinase [Dokdonella sp.]